MNRKKLDRDEVLEHLLDLMEGSSDLTDEQFDELLNDSMTTEALGEVADCRNALLREQASNEPDINNEWNKFNKIHTKRRPSRLFLKGSIVGVAASLALFVVFAWLYQMYGVKEITVCTAVTDPQQIMLTTPDGRSIPVNDKLNSGTLSALGTTFTHKNDTMDLKYSQTQRKPEIHVLSTPRGQDFKLELADGTVVWINSESKIEYPTTFSGKERIVRLTGEAYFKVAKNKHCPFIVLTGNLRTRVLGTEFNIRNYKSSDAHVTLIEGSVEVAGNTGHKYTRIKPGEDAKVDPNGNIQIKEVDVDAYTYWKDGFFYFDNVPLTEIMETLGKWYNVNVVFKNEKILNYRLHYLCERNEGIENALSLLNKMNNISVSLEGNTIIVK